jgi:signal transduction histidine kinase/ActR/RegA family two-component response regulator
MFSDLGNWLFDPSGLTAHGFCLLWEPGLIWTYALSDAGIGLAYFSIPVALGAIARRRRDLVFRPLLFLFATFILLCGTTHWIDVLTLWVPVYGLGAAVKVATALVSLFTAVVLWRFIPTALTLPSPSQFREANAALRATEERLYQSQKMEVVGQLTGGIAHDFNNMIQAVSGGLTLVERRIAAGRLDEVGRFVDEMRRALNNAAGQTNRLLAFSRRQALQPERVQPDQFVGGMREFLQRTIGPEIRLNLKLGDGKSDVICDAHQLEGALMNLAINARDAMPDGGELTISVTDRKMTARDFADPEEAKPGDFVEVSVSDTGFGMTPEILGRAVEPFYTTKPAGQGTGLGLAQVYGFVRQSGGFLRIESEPGRGTTIRISLPGSPRSQEASKDRSKSVDAPTAPFSARGAVLVVEDQTEVRAQIVEVLANMGCDVIEAIDGVEGMRLIDQRRHLDLLITDVGLPGLSGRQLADTARAMMPALRVLFITGYAGTALDAAQLTDGVEILRKPFGLDEFAARVAAILSRPAASAGIGLPSDARDITRSDEKSAGPTRSP